MEARHLRSPLCLCTRCAKKDSGKAAINRRWTDQLGRVKTVSEEEIMKMYENPEPRAVPVDDELREQARQLFDFQRPMSHDPVGEPSHVDSPPHYNTGEIEAIDAIRIALGPEGFIAYCQGNAMKYVWRARYKGAFVQDLAKAVWYLRQAMGDDPREA